MKFIARILLMVVIVSSFSSFASEPVRVWKNTEGKEVQARLLSRTDDTVTIMLTNGRSFILPISSLSEEDKSYLEQKEAPPVRGPEDGWYVNAEDAKEAAEAARRPVLLLFTGSDWCGYCIRLENNVLSTSAWDSFAEENLVLLKVDFPRRKNLSKRQLQENRALQSTYGIRGYPTLVLTDADGTKLTQFGYGGESPKDFIEKVRRAFP